MWIISRIRASQFWVGVFSIHYSKVSDRKYCYSFHEMFLKFRETKIQSVVKHLIVDTQVSSLDLQPVHNRMCCWFWRKLLKLDYTFSVQVVSINSFEQLCCFVQKTHFQNEDIRIAKQNMEKGSFIFKSNQMLEKIEILKIKLKIADQRQKWLVRCRW